MEEPLQQGGYGTSLSREGLRSCVEQQRVGAN